MVHKQTHRARPIDPAADICAAILDLIDGIRWVRLDGPAEAAVLAYAARGCLEASDPRWFRGETRSAFLVLKEAVKNATRGSCLKWNVALIEQTFGSFRAVITSVPPASAPLPSPPLPMPEPVPPAQSSEEAAPKLPDRAEIAYRLFQLAEQANGCLLTDRKAYDWLREQGPGEHKLPSYESWDRYVRMGREHYDDQKNRPRAGRLGRSIVRPGDIEDPSRVEGEPD